MKKTRIAVAFVVFVIAAALGQNANVNVTANVTSNAPKPAQQRIGQCLIVGGETHRINAGRGIVGMVAFASSKGKWAYIDSYHLQPEFVKTKYRESDITDAIKAGVHVIVVHSPKEVTDARIACQDEVPQR
jgi:hypothetical protein